MRYPLLALSLLLLSCGGNGDGDITAPATGSLEIRASTSGEAGADYMIAVDGEPGHVLASNGAVTVPDLEPGFHVVEIVAPPPGCTIVGDNPRTVSVAAGATNVVTFEVTCVPLLGSIEVTTSTTGAGPATYDLIMDGTSVGPIGASAARTIDNVPPGSHNIELGGIPATCQVQGTLPQTVTVEPSATAAVAVAVTCTGPAPTGTLTITTVTTGSDPNGYQVAVDGGAAQTIGLNATMAILNTSVGTHTVLLSDLAPNCSVAGANPVSASVTPGANTTVTFTVTCTETNTPPTAQFTHQCEGLDCSFTSTSTDDETVESWSWDFGDGAISEEENPSHTYASPGTYDVELTVGDEEGATDNVTREVTVSGAEPAATTTSITDDDPDPSNPGEEVTVRFTVSSAGGTPTGSVTVTTSEGEEECTADLDEGAGSCSLPLATAGEHTLTASYSGSEEFASSSGDEAHLVRTETTTTITPTDPDPSELGTVVVEFEVTSAGGTPTGAVTVSSDLETEPCSEELTPQGTGSCELTLTEEGEHTLTAEYSGDASFAPSTSEGEPHVVEPATVSP